MWDQVSYVYFLCSSVSSTCVPQSLILPLHSTDLHHLEKEQISRMYLKFFAGEYETSVAKHKFSLQRYSSDNHLVTISQITNTVVVFMVETV